MVEKRNCNICGNPFRTDPRAAGRQRACPDPECQRERHRRGSREWFQKNPWYFKEETVRNRILHAVPGATGGNENAALTARINWEAVRKLVGLECSIVLEEMFRIILTTHHPDRRRIRPQPGF